jgi:hypothetical protein
MPTKKELIKRLKRYGYTYKDLKKMKKWELQFIQEDVVSFGSTTLAPLGVSPGNLEIQYNNSFSDIYPYVYDNLSGYPWYKGGNNISLPKNKFGESFNYTINQYSTNQATPNLKQMYNISGDSSYSYPIGGAGNNFRYYKSKSNTRGIGF